MKKFPKTKAMKKLLKLSIFVFFSINFLIFFSPQNVFPLEVKPQAEKLLKEKRFTELFDLLETMKKEAKESDALQIEYYSVLSKSMFLDFLEDKEDWENFYNNLDKFNAEIIEAAGNASKKYPVSLEIVEMQYQSWKAYIREDDQEAADKAYDAMVKTVIVYTEESNDVNVFKNIAQKMSDQGKIKQLNELFSSYKDYLTRNNAGIPSIETFGKIAAEYFKEEKIETAVIVYKHYINLVLKNYPKEKARNVLIEISEKFRNHGYYKAKDENFAEEVYEYIVQNIGDSGLTEENLFARAYNLEISGNYKRAQEEYKKSIKLFPEGRFIAEVYTRLGIINLFAFGQADQAQQFFKKVIDDFSNSFFTSFCMYYSALIHQLQDEGQNASQLYEKLIDDKGIFAKPAKQRLDEIRNKAEMDKELGDLLNLVFNKNERASITLTLESVPDRAFINEQVIWTATAQDFSSGTIQPLFNYIWQGDTGSNYDPGNVTSFSTTYKESSPYVVSFIAATGDVKNIISRSLWVHELVVNLLHPDNTYKVGTSVELNAAISPGSIEDVDASFKWDILNLGITQEGRNFQYTFDKAGNYDVQLEANIGSTILKKFRIKVIK